jgi:hypothetical protein
LASRIVTELILAAAKPVVATIRKGKPLPTVLGALAGGALGTSGGLVMIKLTPFFCLVGAIIGATLAAALFKRPPSIPGARATDVEPFQLGPVLQTWTFEGGGFKSLTVLLENALYTVDENTAPWDEVVRKLARGETPDLPLGDLIRLDELVAVEMRSPSATAIRIVHSAAGRTKRRAIDFQTSDARDELIGGLERHFRKAFSWAQRSLDLPRTIWPPGVLAVLAGTLFSAVAWLSAHWTAHPPPPPLGKKEQDPLVRLLVWAGSERLLMVGAIAVLATLAWLTLRLVRPPRVFVIQVSDGAPTI